eukprot:TRINITY_DN247_c0_g1_i2.p2 TRINITY_DN247_c0_g1~~TRINITY_DN247_c0_g1_i2.p2  ORF type:complete len:75 (+),score=2.79 TRINITY_DN247_c0_g1_i2:312-536(+)
MYTELHCDKLWHEDGPLKYQPLLESKFMAKLGTHKYFEPFYASFVVVYTVAALTFGFVISEDEKFRDLFDVYVC